MPGRSGNFTAIAVSGCWASFSLALALVQEQRQSKGGQGGAPRPAELELLWGSVVEGELFTSSHERKALGFTLFALLLPHLQ